MYISTIRSNFADSSLPAEIYFTGPTAQRWAVTKFPAAQAPSAAMLADPSFRVVVSAEKSAEFLRWVQTALDPNTNPNRPQWQTWGDDVVDRLLAAYDRIGQVRSIPVSVGVALQRDRSYSGQTTRPQISPETLAFAIAIAGSDGRDDQVIFNDVSLPLGAVLPQYGMRIYDATSYVPGRFSAAAWTETPAPVVTPPNTTTLPPAPPVQPPVTPPVTPPLQVTPTPPASRPGTIQVAAKVSIVPWLIGAVAVAGIASGIAWWLWPKSEDSAPGSRTPPGGPGEPRSASGPMPSGAVTDAPHSNPSHSFIGSHVTKLGHHGGRHGTILSLQGSGPMMKATVRWDDGSVSMSHGKDLGLVG